MGTLLRSVGTELNLVSVTKRSNAVLSDGSVVTMVQDHNQTGVTGDGGDGTGVAKLYIMHCPVGSSVWTLKATINGIAAGITWRGTASICVDASDNLHVAWRDCSNANVYYTKLTYSAGPTWSVGSNTLIRTHVTSNAIVDLDIDCIGTGDNPVIVGVSIKTDATQNYTLWAWVKNNSGTWISQGTTTLINGAYTYYACDDVTVAAATEAVGGDNIGNFAVAIARKGSNGTDYGDLLYMFKVNISTGTNSLRKGILGSFGGDGYTGGNTGFNMGIGGGYRYYWLFYVGSNQWILAGQINTDPWTASIYAFSWNPTTNVATAIIPLTSSQNLGTVYRKSSVVWAAISYSKSTNTLEFMAQSNYYSYGFVAAVDLTAKIVRFAPSRAGENYYRYSGVNPSVSYSGAQSRNTTPSTSWFQFYYYKTSTANAYRNEIYKQPVPLAPGISPSDGSTMVTDRPTLSATHKESIAWPMRRVKAKWQIASDSGFSSNLRYIDDADTDFVIAENTNSPTNAVVTTTEAVPPVSELFQGTWYLRGLTIDEFGVVSPWSVTNDFTVTHKPVPSNLYPTKNAVFTYGASGQITFSWKFTDPSPSDYQTAYQIIVEDNDTGTQYLDSGKNLTANQQATLTMPVGAKDKNLRWKLRLWDSDDVAGDYSAYQLFYVTDSPAVTITAPTSGATVTTGIPTVSWTTNIGGIKYQKSYKVTVTVGSQTIYDSGWVNSQNLSHSIPVGYLTNSTQYTLTVSVIDSFNLQGSAALNFSTAWTPPASVGPLSTYISQFGDMGFVYVVADPTGIDTDVITFNLKRRKYGETNWETLYTWYDFSHRMGYRDYLVGSGQTYEYTVTQTVDRFTDLLESTVTRIHTVTPQAERYWLIDPLNAEESSIPLFNVVDDPFTEEYESETYSVIGRGRHVDFGDRLGYIGTLSLQLRPHGISGIPSTNYVLNPNIHVHNLVTPTPNLWTLVTAGTVGDVFEGYEATQEPSPIGLEDSYFVEPQGLAGATSNYVKLSQTLYGINVPAASVGQTVTFSTWFYGDYSTSNLRMKLVLYNASNAVIGSADVQNPTVVEQENYVTDTSTNAVAGLWQRRSVSVTWVANVDHVLIEIQLEGKTGQSTGVRRLTTQAAQLEVGAMTKYFDGNQRGAVWLGTPNEARSYTDGYYTGRQQREDIEQVKASRSYVYIRNPFGDIFRAAPGNISVKRIPGTGTTEMTDIEIPYSEVAF
jgi:hypothetical protein